jgi:hypothetical protein
MMKGRTVRGPPVRSMPLETVCVLICFYIPFFDDFKEYKK